MEVEMRLVAMGLALAVVAGACGCGPTFESVKATAAVGDKVGGFEHQFDEVQFYCQALRQETPALACDLKRPAKIYQRSARVIGMYANALSALAADDQLRTKDAIDGMFTIVKEADVGLPPEVPTDAISVAIKALVEISLDAYKKAEIKAIVARAAPHVAALTAELRAAAAVQRDELKSLELAVKTASAASPPPPGLKIVTAIATEYIAKERARIALYDAAVKSFAEVHAKLDAARIDTKDEDRLLLKSILAVVGAALKDARGGGG